MISSYNCPRIYNHGLTHSGASIENNKTAYRSQSYKSPSKFFSKGQKVKDMTGPHDLNGFFLYSLLLYYSEQKEMSRLAMFK